jgi:hypothetical protein
MSPLEIRRRLVRALRDAARIRTSPAMTGFEADDAESARLADRANAQRAKASSSALVFVNESAEHVDTVDVARCAV